MSALELQGRRFAAGLIWLERANWPALARTARRFGRPWYVHHGAQSGYAGDDDVAGSDDARSPEVAPPALAAALLRHIPDDFWMALVLADDGRCALVQARDGAILADGDRVFASLDEARRVWDDSTALGWSLHASPGLIPGAIAIDPDALAIAPGMELRRAPLANFSVGHAAGIVLAVVLAGGAGAAWLKRDALDVLLFGEPPVVESVAGIVLPTRIDSLAFLAACREALAERPPHLLAWRLESIDCRARLDDPRWTEQRPELRDRGVLILHWRLDNDLTAALHRPIAEPHLDQRYLAQVENTAAWALQPLTPVLVNEDATEQPYLAFRRAVDTTFGPRQAGIQYQGEAGGRGVVITTDEPLHDLAAPLERLGAVELTAIARKGGGEWTLALRPPAPVSLPRSRALELAREIQP